jgi:hypothetical protein
MDKIQLIKLIGKKKSIKISVNNNGVTITKNIIPLSISSDGIILGKLEDSEQKITFTLNNILSEDIVVDSKDLNKMDIHSLDKFSNSEVNIKESTDDEVSPEIMFNQNTAKVNLGTWAAVLDVNITGFKQLTNHIVSSELFIKNIPRLILIYPNGDIKISGHKIRSQEEFKNLISFFYEN